MVEAIRETPSKTATPDVALITPIIADGAAPNLPARKASIDEFLKRNAEVLEKDRAEFQITALLRLYGLGGANR